MTPGSMTSGSEMWRVGSTGTRRHNSCTSCVQARWRTGCTAVRTALDTNGSKRSEPKCHTLMTRYVSCAWEMWFPGFLLHHEGSGLAAQTGGFRKQQLWTVEDVHQYGELGLHLRTELLFQIGHHALKTRTHTSAGQKRHTRFYYTSLRLVYGTFLHLGYNHDKKEMTSVTSAVTIRCLWTVGARIPHG